MFSAYNYGMPVIRQVPTNVLGDAQLADVAIRSASYIIMNI